MNLAGRFQQFLFRWRSDGTAPLRLGQRRIFIVPSRGGLLFALALVVMLLGAINYNLALGHALVFLLAGLGVAGMIHTFRNLFGLVITPGRCEPVFAGQTAFFPLALDNERSAPRLALELAATAELPIEAAIASCAREQQSQRNGERTPLLPAGPIANRVQPVNILVGQARLCRLARFEGGAGAAEINQPDLHRASLQRAATLRSSQRDHAKPPRLKPKT